MDSHHQTGVVEILHLIHTIHDICEAVHQRLWCMNQHVEYHRRRSTGSRPSKKPVLMSCWERIILFATVKANTKCMMHGQSRCYQCMDLVIVSTTHISLWVTANNYAGFDHTLGVTFNLEGLKHWVKLNRPVLIEIIQCIESGSLISSFYVVKIPVEVTLTAIMEWMDGADSLFWPQGIVLGECVPASDCGRSISVTTGWCTNRRNSCAWVKFVQCCYRSPWFESSQAIHDTVYKTIILLYTLSVELTI